MKLRPPQDGVIKDLAITTVGAVVQLGTAVRRRRRTRQPTRMPIAARARRTVSWGISSLCHRW